jgi:hypothetical protein
MKMVRPKITERYKDRFDHMYTPQGKNIYNEANIAAIKNLLK